MIARTFLGGIMYAPDDGTTLPGNGADDDLANGVEIDAPVEDETEYVEEGSEEARGVSTETSVSKADIEEELRKTREELAAIKTNAEPVSTLNATMEKFLNHAAPVKTPRKDGATAGIQANVARMDDAEFQKRYNQMILEDPYRAQMELQSRTMEPVLQTFAVNQAQVSRELLLAVPDNKKFYDKYGDEIEEAVASIPVVERIKNPKIYQTALMQVRAAHSDEIAAESVAAQVEAAVAKKLEELGIKSGEMPPKSAQKQGTFVTPSSVASRPTTTSTNVRRIVIPTKVAQEARQRGLDPGFYYEHLKSKGLI